MMLFVLVVSCVLGLVNSANILCLFPLPSPSHHIWNSVLSHALGEKGHNVTVLSADLPFKGQMVPDTVHYLHIEKIYKSLYEAENPVENFDISDMIGYTGVMSVFIQYTLIDDEIYNSFHSSNGFKALMEYPDDFKFDLVIHDFTMGPFMLGFLEKFNNPPLVSISAFINPPSTQDCIGHHYHPSYIPHYATMYDVDMSFTQRLDNFIVNAFDFVYRRYVLTPKIDKIFRPYYPENTPYIGDLEKKTVLALVNSHPAVNYPESLPPNVIEVGGLQITDPQPLPKEIDTFMNNSQKGAIFFSLGTNVKAVNLKEKRIQIILDVMAQLPQYNFLWKMDIDQNKFKISKNVLIKPFFPQRDILGHPKIKVFVTHSGGLSTQEAIWRGVPMIGLALFGDQPRNLHKSVLNGIAAKVDYLTLSVDGLKDTILMVAEDKSFSKKMQERSQLYRDQPMKPLERAVWWVEYVIRNPNATHLRSPALDINFFAAHSLDVLAFLLIIPIVLIVISCKVIRLCFCRKSKVGGKNTNYENRKKMQ